MRLLSVAGAMLGVWCVLSLAFPEWPAIHRGWLNVLLIAIPLTAFWRLRRRSRPALLLSTALFVAAFALAANGLLGADAALIVGAPGQTVGGGEAGGSLVFPAAGADGATGAPVYWKRGRAELPVDPLRYGLTSRMRVVPRAVIYVQAFDERGGALTVTQPTGSAFLSPVLLMQQRQTIANLDVPYDSFSVPAAQRLVKAVLFTAAQTASLHPERRAVSGSAVLFAVDDRNDAPVRGGIVLASPRQRVRVAGITLSATPFLYPAVERSSIPNLIALGAAALLSVAAAVAAKTPSRS